MDGNGRWAQARGLPRVFGHRAGMEALQEVVRLCVDLGIKVLTVFAFSTENWKRPQEEINILMNLLYEYVQKELDELDRQNVCIRVIGHIQELPFRARHELDRSQASTASNDGLLLNIALNYGGRMEIVDAARSLAAKVRDGALEPEAIDEALFGQYLYTAGCPRSRPADPAGGRSPGKQLFAVADSLYRILEHTGLLAGFQGPCPFFERPGGFSEQRETVWRDCCRGKASRLFCWQNASSALL